MNFPGTEFLETESKYKSRKKTWSFCVYHLHKTSREGISRRSRAVTAKKCTKKLAARSKLFFAYQNYFFCRSRCRQRHRCQFWKLPHFNGPREVRSAGQLGPMMRRRRKTLSISRYRKCWALTSKLFSLLSFNTTWTYRYIFFVFVRRDWLYEVPTQHHLRPD